MQFEFNNVNDAFRNLVGAIADGKILTTSENSRAGRVLRIPEPVLIKYKYPKERVLLNERRDANPFFHLFESLWMLAGRNDVESLKFYNSKIGDIASDDGKTFNGAYGYRWRHGCCANNDCGASYHPDQLQILIDHLKTDPSSRRAVLQMWNVEDDLLKIGTVETCEVCKGNGSYITNDSENMLHSHCELCGGKGKRTTNYSKDVCCNTAAYFSIRKEEPQLGIKGDTFTEIVPKYLDMTVTNRSNDLIWGCLGANVVHFSFLQEYMAACLGVEVGTYYQFTNNLHVYENNWKPHLWLAEYDNRTMYSLPADYRDNWKLVPLVKDPEVFDQEVERFIDCPIEDWQEPFLERVAKPACLAFAFHKERKYEEAFGAVNEISSMDWWLVCTKWLRKRFENWEVKRNGNT